MGPFRLQNSPFQAVILSDRGRERTQDLFVHKKQLHPCLMFLSGSWSRLRGNSRWESAQGPEYSGGQSHRNRTSFGTYKLTLITEHQQQSPQGSAPAAVKTTLVRHHPHIQLWSLTKNTKTFLIKDSHVKIQRDFRPQMVPSCWVVFPSQLTSWEASLLPAPGLASGYLCYQAHG